MATFCDGIVVVDDGSDDGTPETCEAAGATVVRRPSDGWWSGGTEGSARQLLWETACKALHGSDQSWIYVADADHLLVGITPDNFRTLLTATHVDAWACPLWDLWNDEDLMRADGYWQAHLHPRPWLARALPGVWTDRGIHAGHLPIRDWRVGLMPDGAAIAHLGYLKGPHRNRKLRAYLDKAK